MKRLAIAVLVLYLVGFISSILVGNAHTSNPPEPLEGTEPIIYFVLATPLLLLVEAAFLILSLVRRQKRK
jgi:Sec-independent protein secretion pathway component TatC